MVGCGLPFLSTAERTDDVKVGAWPAWDGEDPWTREWCKHEPEMQLPEYIYPGSDKSSGREQENGIREMEIEVERGGSQNSAAVKGSVVKGYQVITLVASFIKLAHLHGRPPPRGRLHATSRSRPHAAACLYSDGRFRVLTVSQPRTRGICVHGTRTSRHLYAGSLLRGHGEVYPLGPYL